MSNSPRIVVAGAGAIGCYVGGRLVEAGAHVTFLGRARLGAEIAEHGLGLSDLDAAICVLNDIDWQTDPACLSGADIILVAVKSGATKKIAAQISEYAPKSIVISLQNGISNPDILRAHLPDAHVLGAIVPYNVVQSGPGTFHRATSGDIAIEAAPHHALTALHPLNPQRVTDFQAAQWGKLLVNLNNALNALSGLTLVEQLQNREWRKVLAAQMQETLTVLRAANIQPSSFTAVAPWLVPHILRLPTPLFRRVAKAMLDIDPHARSSMQDDLARGRMTEIDALQGEVLTLAQRYAIPCPTLQRVVAAIKQAETAQNGSPHLGPRDF